MDDLIAFVTARLDEAKAGAWAVHDVSKCDALLYAEDMAAEAAREPDCDCGYPALVLRDVEAKRAILAGCAKAIGDRDRRWSGNHAPYDSPAANQAFRTLLALASAWGSHPDYLPKWKPQA